jgi:hypothetical protein
VPRGPTRGAANFAAASELEALRMDDVSLLPPTLIYGSEMPDVRFRWRGKQQTYFCRRNRNLHLAASDLQGGTYEAGSMLADLCREFCLPHRKHTHQPCPAFTCGYKQGVENKGLATVQLHKITEFEKCAGVKALLDLTETQEERYFLLSYLEDKGGDSTDWRRELVSDWNAGWSRVPEGWDKTSRRGKFDYLLWRTLRFPALIPQVWLNWLHSASDEDMKILEEYPSRVDFVAFWNYERHLIEIDGPSHYASYDETRHTYQVDERAYARNLKIARSLLRDEWKLTRIARIEVRDVMENDFALFEKMSLLGILPFYDQRCSQLSPSALGVGEIERDAIAYADDDIPF